MLLASNPQSYAKALSKFYDRMTPWEKNFKYKNKINFIEMHLINAEYENITFKPNLPARKLLREFSDNRLIVYVVLNSDIQYDLPHTLNNIIIIPKKFKETKYIKKIITHELFHIYFRYFNSTYLSSFRKIRSIIKIERNTFVGEITNPDTEDFEGLRIGNKIIFKVLFDRVISSPKFGEEFYEKYFTAILLPGNCDIRPSTLYEINLYDQQLPFNQNYHSEEMLAELCA